MLLTCFSISFVDIFRGIFPNLGVFRQIAEGTSKVIVVTLRDVY